MVLVEVDAKLNKKIPLIEIRLRTRESRDLSIALQLAIKILGIAEENGAMPLPFLDTMEDFKENQIFFRLMFKNHQEAIKFMKRIEHIS